VAAGEEFDIHLFSDTVEPYSTNAAQFRMDLPPGVTMTGTSRPIRRRFR
jgi:hypothetical protein